MLVYLFAFTVSVRVDGKPVRLSATSTVADLFTQGAVTDPAGNLVAAKDHHVLKTGAGSPPYVTYMGRPLAASDPLAQYRDLVSHNGTDVVEETRVTTETIKPGVRYEGEGPVQTVISVGTAGVREVTTGDVSGQVVRKRTLVAASPELVRRSPLYPGAKTVALTFDDGPWPGSTLAILGILKQYGVVATFFEIGQQAKASPSLSRAVSDAGMELGNHSETHPLNLGRLSATSVSNEITYAESAITHASGQRPTWFRPPGGNTTAAMYPVLAKLKLGWIQWDIDTEDWKRPPATAIVNKVLANVRPGAVVLMHDGGGDRSHTVAALPTIIQKLKAMGYTFVRVDQLTTVPHRMG